MHIKLLRAVAPYRHSGQVNFKEYPYRAWKELGGLTASSHYPPRMLHGLAYRWELPYLRKSKTEARLRFVEPASIHFDTFPDNARYEIVPMIWDCWPKYYDTMLNWIRKHQVKSIIFTSSQTAKVFQNYLPETNILNLTEGIDTSPYNAGNCLKERNIDLLEYGSIKRNFFHHYVKGINHINRANANGLLFTFDDLIRTLSDSKIVISLPRCDTEPETTQGIETLTQRFWEGMLSRCVLLGRAPKELTELVGYNPVITLDRKHADEQVRDIISHINEYQNLVDRNRETALRMASWELRMKIIMDWLQLLGYKCKN